jgi:hypothetical protein
MISKLTAALFASLALLVTACSMPAEEESLTRGLFETVRAGDLGTVYAHLPPHLRTDETHNNLQNLHTLIPQTAPTEVDTERWSLSTNLSGKTIEARHRYTYADRALVVDTRLFTPKGGQVLIQSFEIQTVRPSDPSPPK